MKGFGEIYLLKNDYGRVEGYGVRVFQDGESGPIEEYTAGDSFNDSQVYGTGEIEASRLLEFAERTAQEMMDEHDIDGPISEINE
jgi:hypothetical protein